MLIPRLEPKTLLTCLGSNFPDLGEDLVREGFYMLDIMTRLASDINSMRRYNVMYSCSEYNAMYSYSEYN